MKFPVKSALVAVIAAAALLSASVAAAQDAGSDKIDNAPDDLKAALRAAGVNSTTAALPAAQGDTKIAALDTEELKDAGIPDQPTLAGDFTQGGLVIGQTKAGSTVMLDERVVGVDADGRFIIGFDRDHGESAVLEITYPDGTLLTPQVLNVAPREFNIERIDGLADNKVSTFTPEEEEKIVADLEKKKNARAGMGDTAYWMNGFNWPVTGRISGVFGSQRILNGVPRRFHSGVDVAAPTGTEIRAPADGRITLAEPDMYFEGGLVFIDHGQGLESAIMHMSRIDVEAGDEVKKGDVIGAVGATGRATRPHMHWSLKWQARQPDAQLVVPEMPGS